MAIEAALRELASPLAHDTKLLAMAGGLADRARELIAVARRADKADLFFAGHPGDRGVVFHDRDEGTTDGQDAVDFARHDTSRGAWEQRHQMEIGGAERFR